MKSALVLILAACFGLLWAPAAMAGASPKAVKAPKLVGAPLVGQTVKASKPQFKPKAAKVSFQWQRQSGKRWVSIKRATRRTYKLAKADQGLKVRVRVRGKAKGKNAKWGAWKNSQPLGPVQGAGSGRPQVGRPSVTVGADGSLTVTPDATGGQVSVQWQRCDAAGSSCQDIQGATGSSYQPTTDDDGFTLRVKITVTETTTGQSAEGSATSGDPVVFPPANLTAPTITGTAGVGQTLAADPGTWTKNPSFTYQWQRCAADGSACQDISGQRAATYTATSADMGSTLGVVVTASAAGKSTTASAKAAGVVPYVCTYCQAVLADHPLFYWRMGTAGRSSSGSSSGTLSTYTSDVTGPALTGDPGNAAAYLPGMGTELGQLSPGLGVAFKPMTVEAWVKLAPNSRVNLLRSEGNNPGYWLELQIGTDQSEVRCTERGQFWPSIGELVPITANTWHHVVLVISEGSLGMSSANMYVDGAFAGYADTSNCDIDTNWMLLPKSRIANLGQGSGAIDELAVYSGANYQVPWHYLSR